MELMGLLFLHGMALGAWFVPLSGILDQSWLSSIKPWAFAASAVAAMLAPLFFGALADRSVPPLRVLRWTSLATSGCVALTAWNIQAESPLWLILAVIQLQSIFCSPSSSLTGSIVFSRLGNSQKQFGTIRALGTIGWMAGCWVVSLLGLDSNPNSLYVCAAFWLALTAYTAFVPYDQIATESSRPRSIGERLGLDAMSLLKDRDHRAIFVTAALVAIPLAAFYPYTPPLLTSVGFTSVSAWMSLAQVTEVMVLVFISAILQRWPLKWVVLAGIGLAILRYSLFSLGTSWAVLSGIVLHGVLFTFTYISAQIYLAQRIKSSWRTRAQALLSFMTGGLGNLSGYLLTGAWMSLCGGLANPNWQLYWLGLAGTLLMVMFYFAISYQGQSRSRTNNPNDPKTI